MSETFAPPGRLSAGESGGAKLRAKLALEAELTPILASLMRGYELAWRRVDGRFQPFERMTWLGRFDTLLRRHYGRTVQVFRGIPPTRRPKLEAVAVTPQHAADLIDEARRNAERILAGIERDLLRERLGNRPVTLGSGTDGIRWLKSAGVAGGRLRGAESPATEHKAEKPRFSVSYQGTPAARAGAIANVNTQSVAEATRWTVVENGLGAGVVTKTWQSLLDGRERPAHRAAHDQKVGVADRFVVMGEELRFPGDTKFGASLGNVINCRCSAVYTLERPDGSSDVIDQTPVVPAKRQRRAGDKPGVTRPAAPTTAVTLNGRTRATVALSDGSLATLTQQGDRLVVRVNRQVVAQANIVRIGADQVTLDGLQIADRFAERGIATLLNNSVATTFAREGRRLVPPRLMTDDVFAFWRRRDPAAVATDVRNAADAIRRWARARHGAGVQVRFDADGQTARLLLAGGRQLILSRSDLVSLGLVKANP